MVGIGIGIIIGTLAMTGSKANVKMSQAQIEEKARGYGMDYISTFKVIEKDVSK